MKSTMNYYYKLFPDNIISQDNFFYFWVGENKFYFVPFNNVEDRVLEIYEYLTLIKLKVNQLVFNKDNKLITYYKNEPYALFLVNCLENELIDIKNFFNIPFKGNAVNWGSVWSKKIDYFSYQVSQRALGMDNILNSFSYYVGLAENAIQYYNLIDKSGAEVGIQHKRVYAENYEINFYNPLNMIIDYKVRDLSEYIKYSFMEDKINMNLVVSYIKTLNLNSTMMNLLFARLLFPTYYFDCYEKLVNEEVEEKELIKIIKRAADFEKFLLDFYNFYYFSYNLIKVDWLLKT